MTKSHTATHPHSSHAHAKAPAAPAPEPVSNPKAVTAVLSFPSMIRLGEGAKTAAVSFKGEDGKLVDPQPTATFKSSDTDVATVAPRADAPCSAIVTPVGPGRFDLSVKGEGGPEAKAQVVVQ